ncbi:chorismate mutase [Streptomyces exfoliatus]|uniref:chorismate mutase n=1 Tax=Streptomyces exfoliatus TaxID=1905 RepID=UPI003C2CF494
MFETTDSTLEEQYLLVARLDQDIINLVQQRTDLCRELASQRRAVGGPAIELSRENEVLHRYQRALGPSGTSLGMLLTEIGRRD